MHCLLKDWVQIIEEDIKRQQNLLTQPPFSDAYLNGMPAKRRKVRKIGFVAMLAYIFKRWYWAICQIYWVKIPFVFLKIFNDRKSKMARNSAELLRQGLRQAFIETGSHPVTGETIDDVLDGLDASQVLLNAYEDNLNDKIAQRLHSDPDFDPKKYPNSAEYFK